MDEVWEEFNRVFTIEETQVTGISADIQEEQVTVSRETKQVLETTGTTLFTVEASQGNTIPKNLENNINAKIFNQSNVADDMEIILAFPTVEIFLKIEGILPLDVFYSPKHKVVMSKSRKKTKLEKSQVLVTNETPFKSLWKGAQIAPYEELNRLSRFARAYVSATIDKAAKIQLLMKERGQSIVQLEQTFHIEKQEIEQWQANLTELHKSFNDLKLQFEFDVKDKDEQIL